MQDMKVDLMYTVSEGILLNLNVMTPFYGWVQLSQGYRVTVRRQFTFYHKAPRTSWYSCGFEPEPLDWEFGNPGLKSLGHHHYSFFYYLPPPPPSAWMHTPTQRNTYNYTHFSKIAQQSWGNGILIGYSSPHGDTNCPVQFPLWY